MRIQNTKYKTHNPQPKAQSSKHTAQSAKLRAQSIIEYTVLIAVVVAAFSAMRLYIQRAINAHLKVIEEQINNPEKIDEVN